MRISKLIFNLIFALTLVMAALGDPSMVARAGLSSETCADCCVHPEIRGNRYFEFSPFAAYSIHPVDCLTLLFRPGAAGAGRY